jgi:putative ABC transport system ATP-binding protein/lipoprotein-releasing system ATP-binding protein
MIAVSELTKCFWDGQAMIKAVNNVSFSIKRGEFVSIVGHSGSGKTTLLSLIGGLIKPDFGRVIINNKDIWTLKDRELSRLRNQKIGFVFQFPSLIPTLTVIENVLLPSIFSDKQFDLERKGWRLLDWVGLLDKGDYYLSQLSGGEQRRVALARALINDPEIILADEPTGDLDEETEEQIMKLLAEINKQGVTLLLVTHSKELASIAKRQLQMSKGFVREGD